MNPKFKNNVGVCVPEILFPAESVDLSKWAVVACDQYTSQPDYWQAVEEEVGAAPSTLRIMLPEIFLDKPGEAERIVEIRKTMDEYVANGTLRNLGEGVMLCRRTVDGKTRRGLILALDLECYDYNKGSTTLIRATEGTIVERIPPRLRIRDGAPLELPHILVLIDDEKRTVIEPLFDKAGDKLYDFDLMQKGGHIEGWFVNDEDTIRSAIDAVEALVDPNKYGREMAPLLFAMGDGNHSFATAKANWEKIKAALPEDERERHPARFALVELENVHDEGIIFEPIHRVVFNVSAPKFIAALRTKLSQLNNGGVDINLYTSQKNCERNINRALNEGGHVIPIVVQGKIGYIHVRRPSAQLEVGTLQTAIDAILKTFAGATIDYIHGADVVNELGSKYGNIGFLLPPMNKSAFFRTVVFDGALPRKTFSMGEAHEKRYYLECRKITK